MKEKIIYKAQQMFLKFGFRSITMDDIASEMCISKKTIYKYFINKDVLIEECVTSAHNTIINTIEQIVTQDYNAIEENFEIKKKFKEIFRIAESSPSYQLKKHYLGIYDKVLNRQIEVCENFFRKNIAKGIKQGLYRESLDINNYVKFYYILIFNINENTILEKEAQDLVTKALEYHIRAMATVAGNIELEKHLNNPNV